jgi:fibronectin type 3 domain-containing protein
MDEESGCAELYHLPFGAHQRRICKGRQTDKTTFTDQNLETGKTYYYIVKGICHAKVDGKVKTIYTQGTSASATTDLSAERPGGNLCRRASVSLRWTGGPEVESYIIYRSERENGGYAKVGQTDKTTFTDQNLETGKTYYYIVKGICHAKVDGK